MAGRNMQMHNHEPNEAYREPTVIDIEDALDVLLTAYVEQKRNPVGAKQIYRKGFVSVGDVETGRRGELIDMIENSIGFALGGSISKLGQHLFDFLKIEKGLANPMREMLNSAERIAARDVDQEGRRGAILDKLFDGVGEEGNRWTA
jgi:hypothetical protein